MYEKSSALLTKTQRKYLLGDREYDRRNQERNTRSRIRKRVRAGMLDFILLYQYLDKEDRDRIFEPLQGAEYDPLVRHFDLEQLRRALEKSKNSESDLPEILASLNNEDIDVTNIYGEDRTLDRERVERKIFAMEFEDALFSLLGFVYLGTEGTPVPFDKKIEAAVYQTAQKRLNRYITYDIEVTERNFPEMVETALSKYDEGRLDEMGYHEMAALLEYHRDTIGDLGLGNDSK